MNLAAVPDWAWIALAIAAVLYFHRRGYLDNLLKKPETPSPQPLPPQPVLYAYAPPKAPAPFATQLGPTDLAPDGTLPVLEKLTFRGPVRISVSGDKIELSA